MDKRENKTPYYKCRSHAFLHLRRVKQGFSLIEVTIALALFMVVLGTMAQAYILQYESIVTHQQQTSALSNCMAVVSTLRQVARNLPESEMCAADQPLFPCVLVNWAQTFPLSTEDLNEDEGLLQEFGVYYSLPAQSFTITYTNAAGNDIVVSPLLSANTNPVYVQVATSWQGFRGRMYFVSVNAVLTNE